MYTELEKMASQLHNLTPIAQGSTTETGTDSGGAGCRADGKQESSAGEKTAAQHTLGCQQDQELQDLDDELAAVNRSDNTSKSRGFDLVQ